ncbi:gephyrin-like molybdotransferase Glp [Desulfallas thermosapovorans]|uniref:Molybdopterin molybdenumtransferase n=1 Tax=Desulfallas thermosapovorans DSM 6562 TaxID=1121431 RepID=A0A5S4ZPS9_9FIRM|nr:gephyrin-like molybdotransferase Glp [Desulfallas thermosapovorans]TYO94592.1 molybdopterin molybdotransferase [Desulfallas thermosapovorans DSM 6562]
MLTNVTLEEACELITGNLIPLPGQSVALAEAAGRVCYQDIYAARDLPPCSQSAVDGYAVAMGDEVCNQFQLKGNLGPGDYPDFSLAPGQAAGVVTGGPVPPGTRGVIPWEFAEVKGEYITTTKALNPGDNIKPRGEDFRRGDIVARRGNIVGPGLVGVLAACGNGKVKVFARPKVAVLGLGRGIVPYHAVPAPGETRDCNGPVLEVLARREGAEVLGVETAGHMESAGGRECLKKLLRKADVVITTGGAASGAYDQALDLIRQTGARVLFWGVRIKPGSHSGAAVLDSRLIVSLSGNPAACVVGYHLLVAPALRALQGLDPQPARFDAVCKNRWPKKGGTRRFVRGYISRNQNQWQVNFLPGQKSSMLRSLIDYNALIDLPAGHPPVEEGQRVSVIPLFTL